MSNALPFCNKIEVRQSPVEGFGVFATAPIEKGEILEEVPFILFPRYTTLGKAFYDLVNNTGFGGEKEKYFENLRQNLSFKDPEKYYFKWFPPAPFNGERIAFTVLPLGFGPIYNTANIDNNAGWFVKEKTFVFRAERDIAKDEEIRTFYGYFVAQDGAIYNCETVLNLALDYDKNGRVKCRMARFGLPEQFEASKTNPAYARLGQLFTVAKDGLAITRLAAATAAGEEKVAADIFADIPLNVLYQRLFEFRNSQFPLIKINFEWEDTITGEKKNEPVVFRK